MTIDFGRRFARFQLQAELLERRGEGRARRLGGGIGGIRRPHHHTVSAGRVADLLTGDVEFHIVCAGEAGDIHERTIVVATDGIGERRHRHLLGFDVQVAAGSGSDLRVTARPGESHRPAGADGDSPADSPPEAGSGAVASSSEAFK